MGSDSAADSIVPLRGHLPRKFITKQELCSVTGLSPATVQRYKATGKIPFFQPAGKGARVLFPPDAIEAVLNQSKTENPTEATGASRSNQPATRSPRPGPKPRWRDASFIEEAQ